MNFAGERPAVDALRRRRLNITRRSGSGNGTGFSSTALTTEKMAVLAPMPSASAATAAAVKPRLCPNIRSECRRSLKKLFNHGGPELCVGLGTIATMTRKGTEAPRPGAARSGRGESERGWGPASSEKCQTESGTRPSVHSLSPDYNGRHTDGG